MKNIETLIDEGGDISTRQPPADELIAEVQRLRKGADDLLNK